MSNSNLVFLVCIFTTFASSSCLNKCREEQSDALLSFKQNLSSINYTNEAVYAYCYNWLGSDYYPIMINGWNTTTDCCDWTGVACDRSTGDVIGLDLSCGMLQGTIHPNTPLFNLPRLQRLNLGYNNFTGSQLPSEIGRFSNTLTHLIISFSRFSGQVPANITLLHKLVVLDLSGNDLRIQPHVFDHLITNSTLLKNLSLAYVDIGSGLPTYLNLSNLESIDLSSANLHGKLPDNIFDLQHLERLVLSENKNLTGKLPDVTSTTVPLRYLYLSNCSLVGPIPKSLVNLRRLTYLILSSNNLNGTLPSLSFDFPFLQYLKLDNNMFSGNVLIDLFVLPSLISLDLSRNQFDGRVDQRPVLQKFRLLTCIDLSFNKFIGEWELDTLLSTLKNLEDLVLSYSGLSVTTNNVNHYVSPYFRYFGLASCNLKVFPGSLRAMKNLEILDLSGNGISGHVPLWAREVGGDKLSYLDLSHNLITRLPRLERYGLKQLYLQSNAIQGPFPLPLCNMSSLLDLDLSNNSFHGVIPRCFGKITSSAFMVNLGNNRFDGTIPNVFEDCGALEGLILKGNELKGEVPSSLSRCQSLKVVDMGNNRLNGTFPHWLGGLSELQVLVFKSNHLHGPIKSYELSFPSLQVIDLSHNAFVGQLPRKYFQNFNSMKKLVKESTKPEYLSIGNMYYSIVVAMKGTNREIGKLLVDYTIIDLSSNQFEGEILDVIGDLKGVIVLNLSHNCLTGPIPHALGNLPELESLDLSYNKLTGIIPQSLADLTFLAVLNLSQNHLMGRIPQGPQFGTFDTSFGGNPGLCGVPLPKKCEHPQAQANDDDDDDDGFTWKMVMMGYGSGTVIGLVLGYLMLSSGKPKWFNAIADQAEDMIFRSNSVLNSHSQ